MNNFDDPFDDPLEVQRQKDRRAMEQALMPRTKDGKIVPMVFWDEDPGELLYPCSDSREPMIFAEDFRDGKVPNGFHYVPGYETPWKSPNGTAFDNIVYWEPWRNLSLADQRALQIGRTGVAIVSAAAQTAAAQMETPRVSNEDPVVVNTGDCLILRGSDGPVRLTNFALSVSRRREIIVRNEAPASEILLELTCNGEEYLLPVSSGKMKTLIDQIQAACPMCWITNRVPKADKWVQNYVRGAINGHPKELVYRSAGLIKIKGRWYFVHDTAERPTGVSFETGHAIGCVPGETAANAAKNAWKVLSLSEKGELMVPLFLLMHLAPLFHLFKEAGVAPRFVTFLAGTTGSFKTALGLALFRLFTDSPTSPEANFMDTANALERKLGRADSRVLLLDDFCPAVGGNGKEKLRTLEAVIRYCGDSIGKSRCTTDAELAADRPPVGCCLVTGECTGGSRSSLLRCVVLPIERGDIDSCLLGEFQNDPALLQTHFYYFLQWAGKNGDEIISALRRDQDSDRKSFFQAVAERRLADAASDLFLTGKILLRYLCSLGVLHQAEAIQVEAAWRNDLEKAIRISELCVRELEPLAMYIKALVDLRDAGRLPLASGQASYIPAKDIGFIEGDCWWLRPGDAFQAVARYWRSFDQSFPARDSDIRKLLAQNELIEIEVGKRNGEDRVNYTKRTSLDGRPRMLVLKMEMARAYLSKREM